MIEMINFILFFQLAFSGVNLSWINLGGAPVSLSVQAPACSSVQTQYPDIPTAFLQTSGDSCYSSIPARSAE